MSHHTVHVEIHRVSDEAKPGTSPKCRCMQPCNHAQPETRRTDTQIVNLTTRVDGVTTEDLNRAIDKAVTHLNAERVQIGHELR